MKRDEILATVKTLASAQGFYGRLHAHLVALRDENPNEYDRVMTDLESRHFSDAVDLCIYLET